MLGWMFIYLYVFHLFPVNVLYKACSTTFSDAGRQPVISDKAQICTLWSQANFQTNPLMHLVSLIAVCDIECKLYSALSEANKVYIGFTADQPLINIKFAFDFFFCLNLGEFIIYTTIFGPLHSSLQLCPPATFRCISIW